MNQNSSSDVRFISPLAQLVRRLDECRFSEEYVETIRALAATKDPRAIEPLAKLLDSTGPIATAAIEALLTFGNAVVPAMSRCIDSDDYDMIRHGHQVLAQLGHAASAEWLSDDDLDRAEAFLEKMGVTLEQVAESILANDGTEEEGVA